VRAVVTTLRAACIFVRLSVEVNALVRAVVTGIILHLCLEFDTLVPNIVFITQCEVQPRAIVACRRATQPWYLTRKHTPTRWATSGRHVLHILHTPTLCTVCSVNKLHPLCWSPLPVCQARMSRPLAQVAAQQKAVQQPTPCTIVNGKNNHVIRQYRSADEQRVHSICANVYGGSDYVRFVVACKRACTSSPNDACGPHDSPTLLCLCLSNTLRASFLLPGTTNDSAL
jgi:hypothetical protein